MHLTSSPLLDEVLAADSTQRQGLLIALVEYLQHRQTSTGVSVNQLAQLTKSRASANKRRHTDALERLARIEARLRRLDEQMDDLRLETETLRVSSPPPVTSRVATTPPVASGALNAPLAKPPIPTPPLPTSQIPSPTHASSLPTPHRLAPNSSPVTTPNRTPPNSFPAANPNQTPPNSSPATTPNQTPRDSFRATIPDRTPPNSFAVTTPNRTPPNGHVAELGALVEHSPAVLRVEGLSKEIDGTCLLEDITFDVYAGEIVGFIGPARAGKTLLLECLAGMRPRTGGTFCVGGEAQSTWDPRDLLFYLPNNVAPYAELFTLEVLEFFGRLYEVEPARWEQIVMRDLSLAPVLGKRVSALSQGVMQRLLIALACMSPQPLLALDEPFDGLNLHEMQAIAGILRGPQLQSRTVLLCTQHINDAERICDRFVLLSAGRLLGTGTLSQLRTRAGQPTGGLQDIFAALM